MVLAFYEELSCAEIAAVVGSPVGTVKTRMFHARRRLQAALEQGQGAASGAATLPAGESRLELSLLRGAGRPGSWRLDFAGARIAGLRLLEGELLSAADRSLVARLRGRPGERVVLAFETRPWPLTPP
jgi:hypothetical protein